ncbi:membrane protein insertion efficiency factor YidD [Nostoc sp. FACHB-280]|uniref:membrane protein insertion efficiency factor YidD n=1 Tax=Nostoc sp. FACHB-280 TaxID=2692839 RepID=UPI00168C0688|nr:membrane protein insertion efficiency factor YidD [Nostoc sp. FACHB-280]MBD2492810.1 membrane protein insertion efficiency factor YidD [Nostoc sp. FACHB-280]
MEISLLDSFTRQVSVSVIAGYQKHISPHKGFACAHRILYGGESCSQYIKSVIAQEGLRVAFIKSRTRFQACKQANLILRSQLDDSESSESEDEANTQQPKKDNGSNNYQPSNTSCSSSDSTCCVDCADLSCNCADITNVLSDCDFFHCHAAHCSVVDCSSLDCSGADCGFLDCGSCGS